MEKKYNLPEENPEKNMVNEPAVEYGTKPEAVTEMKFSSPLTEEELRDMLTTDEVIDVWCKYLEEKFNK